MSELDPADHVTTWLTALAIVRAIAEGDTEAFAALWPWQEPATPGSAQDLAYHITQIAAVAVEVSAMQNGSTIAADLDGLTAAVLDTG